MKFFLLVTVLAQTVFGGNVGIRTSNLLSPADVTYVDGSYHAGLTAGPLAYSASVAQPVYQTAGVAAAPAVAVGSQQIVQTAAAAPAVAIGSQQIVQTAAAPVAYAAPAAKYAAIPTVQHVQGVADVPVTRIDAQPAVIQKTVDLARPAVKTQRYEVRRPAIQKQFYDIEERVVVRPAGSAVVELDEPLSRTQKGPSVIQPTGDAVAVSSSSSVAVPTAPVGPTISSVTSVTPAPPELPSVEISRGPAPPAPPPASFSAPVEISRTAYAAPSPVLASAPAPIPAAGPSVGIARASYAAAAAPAPIPSVGITRASYAAAPAPPQAVEVRTTVSAPAPVPVPSVGYARAAVAAPAPPPVEIRTSYPTAPVQSVSYSAPVQSVGISALPVKTVSVSAPVQTATISGVSAISSGVSGISSVSAGPTQVSFSTPTPQYQQQIVQSTPVPQLSDDSVSIDSADFRSGLTRSYTGPQTYAAPAQVPTQETVFRSALPPRRFSPQPAAAPRSSLIVNYPNPVDLIPQSRFSAPAVYSEGNFQSQINHENQQRLIQLLTARGGVSEVGFGRSGPASYPQEAGQVRARVLSATPAPAFAAPAGERVNTRRVVVSRPIETLQEVEVAEPVTKYERVRVDQPAVVKTASQDVVRVPTSVPVYGKTLAPIAEAPIAAYSSDWH